MPALPIIVNTKLPGLEMPVWGMWKKHIGVNMAWRKPVNSSDKNFDEFE